MTYRSSLFQDLETSFRQLRPKPLEGIYAVRQGKKWQWKLIDGSRDEIQKFRSITIKAVQAHGITNHPDPVNYWLSLLWTQIQPQIDSQQLCAEESNLSADRT